MNGIIDDSPVTLTGGRWVPGKHGIQRWVPDPPSELTIVPDMETCPICHTTASQPCRRANGKARNPHKGRLIPRCCPCGGEVGPWKRWCEDCRPDVSRAIWRASAQRRRKDAEADAYRDDTKTGAA